MACDVFARESKVSVKVGRMTRQVYSLKSTRGEDHLPDSSWGSHFESDP